MKVITSYPIYINNEQVESGDFYLNAEGDKKVKGEKLKGFFTKFGKNIVKGAKAVGRAIVKVEHAIAGASKKVVKGVKLEAGKIKEGTKKLIHHKKKDGSDIFTKKLPVATPETPKEKVVEIAGKQYSIADLPTNKDIVQTTDENGNAIAGVEFNPNEVVGITGADGNIEYQTPDAIEGGMSKNLKIALIAGGSLLLVGIIIFAIRKRNKG